MFYSFSSSCPPTGTSVITRTQNQISKKKKRASPVHLKTINLFGHTQLKTTKQSLVNILCYVHGIQQRMFNDTLSIQIY